MLERHLFGVSRLATRALPDGVIFDPAVRNAILRRVHIDCNTFALASCAAHDSVI
jgi:hypothetical protein